MSKRIEVNQTVFLVPVELMQETFNLLQTLKFSEVHGTISQLLQLKSLPIKDFSLNPEQPPVLDEVKVEKEASKTEEN